MVGEVELKARIESKRAMANRIIACGGRLIRNVSQEDLYYKHPCYDFMERDEALRLRREDSECRLAFKGRRLGIWVKMREEIEVGVDNWKAATSLLQKVGFKKAFVIRKERSVYSLDGAEVSLDSVEGLGDYIEIELIFTDSLDELMKGAGQEVKQKLHRIAEKLDIASDMLTTESYLELLASKSSSSKASR